MPVVNVRNFDGSDDVIRVSSPPHFTVYTWAVVLQRATAGSGEFPSPISIGGAGTATPDVVVTFTETGELQMRHGGDYAEEASRDWNSTNLMLVVITRSAASAPRFHVLEPAVSGTMVHLAATSDNTANPADWTALSDDEMRFGNWNSSFNFFEGTMVVQALWYGTDLSTNGSTDAAVAALAGGDRDDWVTAGADGLWEFDQASTATAVTDYVGSCDQTGIVGTSVTTLDVPTTVYQFAGSTAVGRNRSRPLIRV